MRLAPVPLRFARDAARAVHLAGESSRTTRGATEAVDACRNFAALMTRAMTVPASCGAPARCSGDTLAFARLSRG